MGEGDTAEALQVTKGSHDRGTRFCELYKAVPCVIKCRRLNDLN